MAARPPADLLQSGVYCCGLAVTVWPRMVAITLGSNVRPAINGATTMSNNNQTFDITAIASLYHSAAERVAVAKGLQEQAQKEVSKQGKGIWGAGLEAVQVAHDNGHNAASMITLFGIALATAGVPDGTFKGYQSDLAKLREEVQTGNHPITGEATGFGIKDAMMISRADARKRYKVYTDEEIAREALATLTKEWNADSLQALVAYARSMDGKKQEDDAPQEQAESKAA